MAPLQFKQYSISTRILRWKINKDCDKKRRLRVFWIQRAKMEIPLMLCDIAVATWAAFKPNEKCKAESCQKLIAKLIK